MTRLMRIFVVLGVMAATWFFMLQPVLAANCYTYTSSIGLVCEAEPSQPTFVEPQSPIGSFIPTQQYARLNDNIWVYSEASLSSPQVRNVGDGYLFVTFTWWVTGDDGNRWYVINPGEYVRAEDLRVHEDSEFSGVEIHQQPVRPFGWMLVDYWPSREPGAEPTPGDPKLPRYTFFEVYDAQIDDQGWIWYNIGSGYWMKQTYVSITEIHQRPEEIGPDEYWVEVDIYEQRMAAYVGDRMVYAGLVSTGLNRWPTYEGIFQVWDRFEKTKMSGAEGKIDYYFIEDVPHTMYIDRVTEIALHGAFWHDRFGYKHSHGCINMPPRDAEWVFNWSKNAPNDLWVWVHTSDPNHYFERYDPVETFAGP
ncbi:MAG: L,D-transpeptidase [Chloroflexi bacterium]|nr:L,D-transpeptidase [Chloroflexota bacterium]